jgi:hypothetical protein
MERIQLHFGVQRPMPMHIDQFPADIPLATNEPHETALPAPAPSEKVNQP